MREKIVENHFVWAVERIGGKTYKFTSPGRKGVADRIACLPDGNTWFVELKTKGGRLSVLQKLFADDITALNQKYACLWTKDKSMSGLKVLVACEFSGTVREAFAKRGHDAWSCDLEPTDVPGNHYQGSVFDILGRGGGI